MVITLMAALQCHFTRYLIFSCYIFLAKDYSVKFQVNNIIHINIFIFKMLLNKSITLADIEAVDPDLHQSLTWMLDNCIEVRENGEGNFYNQNEQIKKVSNKK